MKMARLYEKYGLEVPEERPETRDAETFVDNER
jgi:hypothetical protein